MLLDFGIAKQQDMLRKTRTSTAMGTPGYMAPEQFTDASRAGARTDVYALGLILHKLLSGVPRFDGDSLYSVMTAVCGRARSSLAGDGARTLAGGDPAGVRGGPGGPLRELQGLSCGPERAVCAGFESSLIQAGHPTFPIPSSTAEYLEVLREKWPGHNHGLCS